jgi:hypothetical protein
LPSSSVIVATDSFSSKLTVLLIDSPSGADIGADVT